MQVQEKNYRVVLIGQQKFGKTELFNALFQIPKQQNSTSINGIRNKSKYFEIEGKSVNLEILDTPGSQQYQTLRRSTYKGSQALVFIYDVTDYQSAEFISYEIQLIVEKQLCSYDCSAIVIGVNPEGKQRQVQFQEISAISNAIGTYVEVSINDKQKIIDIFKNIALQRIKFDNEDIETKSMMEKYSENIKNHSMQQLKQKYDNKNKMQVAPAAPGGKNEEKQKHLKEPKLNLIKCLLIGDAQVGKTSICIGFADKTQFSEIYLPTIGIDFRISNHTLDNENYKLQIWDTAGIQKFKTITQAYYSGAKAAFIVYDVTKQESFQHAKFFVSDYDAMSKQSVRYRCLVGNKTDLPRYVSTQQGMALAQQLGTDFVEVSAKNPEELQNLFMRAVKFFHEKNTEEEHTSS